MGKGKIFLRGSKNIWREIKTLDKVEWFFSVGVLWFLFMGFIIIPLNLPIGIVLLTGSVLIFLCELDLVHKKNLLSLRYIQEKQMEEQNGTIQKKNKRR